MHLKTLTLAGFKSFADRTRIECEPGVTVVVGPNGSGKSNLVDAVAWVMGTQATTALRTQRMDDVIFAGTAVRPALGRAEVALTFDNGSGRLALDMAEVTITRRLFRDGTSEYEINGTPCRLLDIQELLSDSGVGRHQHVIVGQGRIDGVLNAGPDEHRAVIEEAAGVIKHRQRRERSTRRLEATDIDLQRARDLLAEEQRRLRPLKRQASAARRHEAVRSEWRALRLWLGGEQLRAARSRRTEISVLEEAATRRRDEAVAEREAIAASLGEMHRSAGDAGAALERDRVAASTLETIAERLHTIALVARERRLGIERSTVDVEDRRRSLEAGREELEREVGATREEQRLAAEAAERAEIALRSLEDEERSLADADRLPTEGMVASLQGDLAALEAGSVRDERERLDLTRRRSAVAALIEEEQSKARGLASEAQVLAVEIERARGALEKASEAASRDRSAAEEADQRWRAAEIEAASAHARLEALDAASRGLADPEVRRRAASIESVIGTITQRLDPPPGLETAIAAVLGPWVDAFVAPDGESVGRAAAEIKAAGLGGVAFVSAAAGRPVATARAVAAEVGVDALIDRLGPAADQGLASTLLGDVVLVEGWSAARSIVEAHPAVRAVTPEGDLVTGIGIVAAHPDGLGAAALEPARVAAERAVTEQARSKSRRLTAMRAAQMSAATEREAAGAVADLERRLGALDEASSLLERSRGDRSAEMERLDARLRALAEAAVTRLERMDGLRDRLGRLGDDDVLDQDAWDDLARRRIEVAGRRDEARRAREDAAAALAAATERRALQERRLEELAGMLDEAGPGSASEPANTLEAIEERAKRAIEAVRAHVTALRDRERAMQSEAGAADARLEQARERREHLASEVEAAREELSLLAVEAAELRVREEAVAEALRREVDADEEVALAAPGPDVPEGRDAEEHLDSLAASLRRLGPVNPLAAAEYEEVANRAAFMEEQLADLEASRSELRKVIRALDEEIARLFMEAFDEISQKFAENFSLLFPGGTGRLSLTDPDDPLTTGVDIHAQPMGKKVGRLSLLSGGERSLAALAFLFAVFRSRPSPFYVLDEVEAALDDANLRRFIRLVSGLRSDSQLVIVTHQQQTMEAADILYGVTMEPGETSRVLAKRLAPV